ncbi:HrpB1 family type III secretion system apparatus protein [Paraburkholderia sp. BR14320]|uniref:HrpB1 family type III secretion system apparatus protein n=1 Tax=unclassified Paraburkholderia TaxID=2615204 RepID=UPI0034CFC31F
MEPEIPPNRETNDCRREPVAVIKRFYFLHRDILRDYLANVTVPFAVRDVLLWIFSEGLHLDARTDLEDLLLLLRQIHPRRVIVDTYEVRMLIKSQRWLDALRLLRQIEAQGYGSPVIAALQSWCLYRLADHDWKRCALEVLHSSDTAALAVVATFLGVEGAGSAGVAEALRAKLWACNPNLRSDT